MLYINNKPYEVILSLTQTITNYIFCWDILFTFFHLSSTSNKNSIFDDSVISVYVRVCMCVTAEFDFECMCLFIDGFNLGF